MAVTLTGSGGLFTRLKLIIEALEEVDDFVGDPTADALLKIDNLQDEYDGDALKLKEAIADLPQQVEQWATANETIVSQLFTAAQDTLIEMVDADNPLRARTVLEALKELIRQMESSSDSVEDSAPTATVTAGSSNTGDGTIFCSVKDDRGRALEHLLPEDVECERLATAQTFRCRGEVAAPSKQHWKWAGQAGATAGSGADKEVNVSNADDGDGVLTDGGFENFTSNDPDDWDIVVGVAGTDIKQETTDKLRGSSALEFDGDGSTSSRIRQLITANVTSRGVYAVCAFIKLDVVPVAGVFAIDLHDGTAIIADDEGDLQRITSDLTTGSTSWVPVGGFFRLPDPLPANVYFRVRLNAALSAGSSLFVDQVTMVQATQLYDASGPYLGAFAGGTDFAKDDTFKVALANTRELFTRGCDRMFDMRENGLLLPTSATPTIT